MEVINFGKVSEPYGYLGNMSPYPITHDGKIWRTAEALFQALRFNDESIREEIRQNKSPMGAKFVAKKYADRMIVSPTSEEDVTNMAMVVSLKAHQHDLGKDLLATGDKIIIEDVTKRQSGRNMFWGAALINGEWVGENHLGKIWMRLREKFVIPQLKILKPNTRRKTMRKRISTEKQKAAMKFLSGPYYKSSMTVPEVTDNIKKVAGIQLSTQYVALLRKKYEESKKGNDIMKKVFAPEKVDTPKVPEGLPVPPTNNVRVTTPIPAIFLQAFSVIDTLRDCAREVGGHDNLLLVLKEMERLGLV